MSDSMNQPSRSEDQPVVARSNPSLGTDERLYNPTLDGSSGVEGGLSTTQSPDGDAEDFSVAPPEPAVSVIESAFSAPIAGADSASAQSNRAVPRVIEAEVEVGREDVGPDDAAPDEADATNRSADPGGGGDFTAGEQDEVGEQDDGSEEAIDDLDPEPAVPWGRWDLPREVDAVLRAIIHQQVRINSGTMIGAQYTQNVFGGDSYFAYRSEYLQVVERVFAPPSPVAADQMSPYSESDRFWAQTRWRDFDEVVDEFAEKGTVLVLSREPHTGRTIMAQAIMKKLLDKQVIEEVRPIPFGGSTYFSAHNLPREGSNGYILTLPSDEGEIQIDGSFGSTLQSMVDLVAHSGSRLIVLTRPRQWRRVGTLAPAGLTVELGTASPVEIARRWLLAHDPDFPVETWMTAPAIVDMLDKLEPVDVLWQVNVMLEEHREAALLAERVAVDVHAGEVSRTRPPSEQIANVVAARRNWDTELIDWHDNEGRQRSSFERSFLLAAAVLREGPASVIYAHAARLAGALAEDGALLEGQRLPGLIGLTRAIHARRARGETLVFTRPYWDDAAVAYFWDDRPLARRAFLEWLATVPTDTSMTKDALEEFPEAKLQGLAVRISEFALRWAIRHRRPVPLQVIVTEWHTDPKLRRVAVEVLDAAATEHADTSYVQKLLLQWAKTKQEPLQLAVIGVCTGAFGRWHTLKALNRLKHVADRLSASTSPEVEAALEHAFEELYRDPTVRARVLETVTNWCQAGEPRNSAGRSTFAVLAAATNEAGIPLLLETVDADQAGRNDEGVDTEMIVCWRTLLDEGTDSPAGSRRMDAPLFLWLDTAIAHADLRVRILQILRRAVQTADAGNRRGLEALRTSASFWSDDPDHRQHRGPREALRRELSKMVDDTLPRLTFPYSYASRASAAEASGRPVYDQEGV